MLVVTLGEALIKWTAPCKQKGLEIIDRNKMILMCHYFEAKDSKQNLPSCFLSCLCLNSLTNHQESRLQHPSLKANQDHSWLNHRAFSWSSEPIAKALGQTCVSWLPVAPLKQEVALIQRDASCPRRPTDTISLQWYVACSGNIADGNRVLGTASYLIHWPTSDSWLVLIKWLGKIWLRKATMPSDSRRNLWTSVSSWHWQN